jgi:alpha-glucuronidase
MHLTLIGRQLSACESAIRELERHLPYADGPAYGQDKDRIRTLRDEAQAWRDILAVVTKEAA